MGAKPGGAPLRSKAPLWVDRWLGERVAVRSPKILHVKTCENVHSNFHVYGLEFLPLQHFTQFNSGYALTRKEGLA